MVAPQGAVFAMDFSELRPCQPSTPVYCLDPSSFSLHHFPSDLPLHLLFVLRHTSEATLLCTSTSPELSTLRYADTVIGLLWHFATIKEDPQLLTHPISPSQYGPELSTQGSRLLAYDSRHLTIDSTTHDVTTRDLSTHDSRLSTINYLYSTHDWRPLRLIPLGCSSLDLDVLALLLDFFGTSSK